MTDILINSVRRGFYMDSVALMRLSRSIVEENNIQEAALMMGTPANKEILKNAGLLSTEGAAAEAGDLIIGIRAIDQQVAEKAQAELDRVLDRPAQSVSDGAVWAPRTLRTAVKANPSANFALISVPGQFAAAEARKALRRGLHTMIFSDNVSLEDEVALKKEASELGLFVMGPDCGTAIINGVPIAFANNVRRGSVGIIGASGTGIQEVSCLVTRYGGGISHAIGVGGRDLSARVGGISMLMALEALSVDAATSHVVLISKPPAPEVAQKVIACAELCPKPVTVCFVGDETRESQGNVTFVKTLKAAAQSALGNAKFDKFPLHKTCLPEGRHRVCGLYTGGTLAAETQGIFIHGGARVALNSAIPDAELISNQEGAHVFIDLGDDEYTRGRPHPMIEPAVREEPLLEVIHEPSIGVLLLDVVIGNGVHPNPAGQLVEMLSDHATDNMPTIITAVTGTDEDPQCYAKQVTILRDAGIAVAPSNADAALAALKLLQDNT